MANITNLAEIKANTTLLINGLEKSRLTIEDDLKCGIIDEVGAVRKEIMIDSKILEAKKSALAKIHVTKNGTPREIKYLENSEIWRTFVEGKKPIYGKNEETVIDKLFDYYGLSLNSTKFEDVFRDAVKEKRATANSDDKTIKHNKSSYQRFFVKYSNTLPKRDVRNITASDLKRYTQEWVNSKHPTKTTYMKYKEILNIIFRYALENGYIVKNPVNEINNWCYYKSMSAPKKSAEEKIFSEEEIEKIKAEVEKRKGYKKYNGYFINGYAILFSIETGVRCAELCSLKWSDISDTDIWIHSQQIQNASYEWVYYPRTKQERYFSEDMVKGRRFPLTKKIKAILDELKAKQEQLGIKSEYVFCHEDGDWIKTTAYQTCLRRLCRHVFGKDTITNNHAFRMSLNSNVFIQKGLPATERAKLLGHSIETNLHYYSKAGKGNISDICELLDA